VYLCASREVLAQEIERLELKKEVWGPVGPAALPGDAVEIIARALVGAQKPLVITGYSGRDRRSPGVLVQLADLLGGLRVHDTGGSDVCFPASHSASEGFRLSTSECTTDADVILVLDCDVPWIPSQNPPNPDAKIYHIDIDPLNAQLRTSFFPAHGRWRADSFTALSQLLEFIKTDISLVETLSHPRYTQRAHQQAERHGARMSSIHALADLSPTALLTGHNIASLLRSTLPPSTTFVIEAVTNSTIMHDHIQPSEPGKWLNCGATGIGWSNGAAMGVKLALQDQKRKDRKGREVGEEIVCQVVGDGSWMCAAPESAVWVGRKYRIPVLSVVLNNGGTLLSPVTH
jgi:thiamine pyrophosphate-dependent acetolactate synthase large subunit-like protein